MARTTLILVALIAVLSGVLLAIYFRPAPATDESAVRVIVAQMLDERMAQDPQAPAQEKTQAGFAFYVHFV